MCDPEMVACQTPCPDWTDPSTNDTTVGQHDGHCCFLRDGHHTPALDHEWRTGDDECRPPTDPAYDEPAVQEVPC